MPWPLVRVVNSDSKIFDRIRGSIPEPLSATQTQTYGPAGLVFPMTAFLRNDESTLRNSARTTTSPPVEPQASPALVIKLVNSWEISVSHPKTLGSEEATSTASDSRYLKRVGAGRVRKLGRCG